MVLFTAFSAQAQTPVLRTEIINEVVVELPIEGVFDFASTASNWPIWHPNTFATTGGGDDHSADVGEEIIETVKVAGIPSGKLYWTVAERVEPSRWRIVGRTELGSIRFNLTYLFFETPEGHTLFRRHLIYEMDRTLAGLIFNSFFAPYMRSESAVALQQFKEVMEGL